MEPPLHGIELFAPTGATQEIVGYVDEAVQEIESFRPLDAALTSKLAEEILFDRVHSSAVTEGNRLTRRETIVVLSEGVVEAGSRRDRLEVKNLANAMIRLQECLDTGTPLDPILLRQLHHLILAELDEDEAGAYRTEDIAISGAAVRPPAFQDVPELMRSILEAEELESADYHPLQKAAWLHWAICRVHPFTDGNGRIARLAQDHRLLKEHYVPSVLRAEDRDGDYYDALEAADLGNGKALLELVARNTLRVSDRYLSIIRESEDKKGWLASISKAATEVVRQTHHRRYLAVQRSGNRLKAEFASLARELSSRVPDLQIFLSEYGGIDLDQFLSLEKTGRAKRTWHFGLDFRIGETVLRYIFWYGTHRPIPEEKVAALPSHVTILISEEEEERNFRLLDELAEDRITVREIVPDGASYWRRRFDPVSDTPAWDRDVSPGRIARDFFEEVMGKLGLL